MILFKNLEGHQLLRVRLNKQCKCLTRTEKHLFKNIKGYHLGPNGDLSIEIK